VAVYDLAGEGSCTTITISVYAKRCKLKRPLEVIESLIAANLHLLSRKDSETFGTKNQRKVEKGFWIQETEESVEFLREFDLNEEKERKKLRAYFMDVLAYKRVDEMKPRLTARQSMGSHL
jgi:hypothetical protein